MRKIHLNFILSFCLCLYSSTFAVAQNLYLKNSDFINRNYIIKPVIVSVVDGDTIKIRLKERDTGVRLTGIDCYETSVNKHIKYQRNKGLTDEQIIEKGLMAKQELIKILRSHKNIYLEITGVDHYSRLVGIFYYKDKKGHYVSINDEMMNTGYCPQFIYNAKRK